MVNPGLYAATAIRILNRAVICPDPSTGLSGKNVPEPHRCCRTSARAPRASSSLSPRSAVPRPPVQDELDLLGKILGASLTPEHAYASSFCGLAFGIQNQSSCPRQAIPFAGLLHQLLATLLCERIEPCLAIAVAYAPFGAEPFLVFQPLQSHIQRSMFDKENIFRLTLDRTGNTLPVTWAEERGFLRISRSRVPCSKAIRSSLLSWVDILPKYLPALGRMSTQAEDPMHLRGQRVVSYIVVGGLTRGSLISHFEWIDLPCPERDFLSVPCVGWRLSSWPPISSL